MKIRVAALNLGHSTLGIARCLAPLAIKIDAFTCRSGDYGTGSRHVNIVTAPDSAEPDGAPLLESLLQYAKAAPSRPILFPTRDLDVRFLDTHRYALDPFFLFAQPKHDILDSIINKSRLTIAAAQLGLSIPRTISFDGRRPITPSLSNDLIYPVIIKPVYAHEPHVRGISVGTTLSKAHIARTPRDAATQASRLLAEGISVLVQEFISGSTDRLLICGGYIASDSKRSAAFTARKRLQYPEDAGLGKIVETVDRPDLATKTISLLKHLSYTGIFEAEFKEDAHGIPHLIEINPRHWDQHILGLPCGVDVTMMAVTDLSSRDTAFPHYHYHHAIWYDDPFVARLALARNRQLRQFNLELASISPPPRKINSVFLLSDPIPALTGYFHLALDLATGLLKRLGLGIKSKLLLRKP